MKNIVVNHYKILIVLTLTNLVAQWVSSFQIVKQPLDTQEWKNKRASRNLKLWFPKSYKNNPGEATFKRTRKKQPILTSEDWGDLPTSSESSKGVSTRKPGVGVPWPTSPYRKNEYKPTLETIPERTPLKWPRWSSLWRWGKRNPPASGKSGKDSSQAPPGTSGKTVPPSPPKEKTGFFEKFEEKFKRKRKDEING